jgi:hypothetical protein
VSFGTGAPTRNPGNFDIFFFEGPPLKFVNAVVTGLAVVVATLLVISTSLLISLVKYRNPSSPDYALITGDGYFTVVHVHVWRVLFVFGAVFAAGLISLYRRAR